MGAPAQPEGPFSSALRHTLSHRPSTRLPITCLSPRGRRPADPVRPIDPATWLSHTVALTGAPPRPGTSPCSSAVTRTSSSSLTSSVPGAPRKSQGTEAPGEGTTGSRTQGRPGLQRLLPPGPVWMHTVPPRARLTHTDTRVPSCTLFPLAVLWDEMPRGAGSALGSLPRGLLVWGGEGQLS